MPKRWSYGPAKSGLRGYDLIDRVQLSDLYIEISFDLIPKGVFPSK
jgi:hypothetical protein